MRGSPCERAGAQQSLADTCVDVKAGPSELMVATEAFPATRSERFERAQRVVGRLIEKFPDSKECFLGRLAGRSSLS